MRPAHRAGLKAAMAQAARRGVGIIREGVRDPFGVALECPQVLDHAGPISRRDPGPAYPIGNSTSPRPRKELSLGERTAYSASRIWPASRDQPMRSGWDDPAGGPSAGPPTTTTVWPRALTV